MVDFGEFGSFGPSKVAKYANFDILSWFSAAISSEAVRDMDAKLKGGCLGAFGLCHRLLKDLCHFGDFGDFGPSKMTKNGNFDMLCWYFISIIHICAAPYILNI